MPNCTKQSWKKARVWGWRPEECASALYDHLRNSAHHKLSHEAATETVATAKIEKFSEWQDPAEKKRKRGGSPEATSRAPQTPLDPPKRRRSPSPPRKLAAGERQQAAEPLQVQVAPVPGQLAVAQDQVTISRSMLLNLVDSCVRQQRALQNAQRLSMAAASSFAEEQSVVSEIKIHLEAALRR